MRLSIFLMGVAGEVGRIVWSIPGPLVTQVLFPEVRLIDKNLLWIVYYHLTLYKLLIVGIYAETTTI